MKNKSFVVVLASLLVFSSCNFTAERTSKSLVQYVDPFIGTDFHGHTFPGAATPFGMVQLSPDTRSLGWDACAGYHYSDSSILGFSHTHLSGTGIGDYGDVLFMPFTGKTSMKAGEADNPDSGFRSRFDRDSEQAEPGYYAVNLTDYGVNVELTATPRVGFHKYTFPESELSGVVIDLTHTIHGHENPLHELKVLNEYEIQGLKQTRGWAKKHYVYFTAKFSKPFKVELFLDGEKQEGATEVSGKNAKARLSFATTENEVVYSKVGISPVGYEGSIKNLNVEVKGWEFDEVRQSASAAWEEKLAKFTVETEDLAEKRKFYTAVYHSYLNPHVYGDVDGSYRGMDQEIYQSDSPNYTVFSLWDTHRALHPLFTIAEPEFNQALIRALLKKYDEGGILPMWELASNYTGTMIGSHSVSVIVDAYMKGQRDFDAEKALEAIVHSVKFDTIKDIAYSSDAAWSKLMPKAKMYEETLGFIPCDLERASVAMALEYAYNYWAIATMAQEMGEKEIAMDFFERSKRYQTYFNKETGFMRGKRMDGSWDTPFHPRHSAHWQSPYVEGNAWQWTWYVPHDVEGLIDLMGGKEAFAIKLDSLFTVSSEVLGEHASADITGLIGQYAHGNEPSHHIIHMFNYVDMPWRTQELVDQVISEFYTDQPDGLCGNEDCGQMSAWYLLNAMGIYPVCPGDPVYSIGKPVFDKVAIDMGDNKIFTVIAENRGPENPYVQEVFVNGEKITGPFIEHAMLKEGATLRFVMGKEKKLFWN